MANLETKDIPRSVIQFKKEYLAYSTALLMCRTNLKGSILSSGLYIRKGIKRWYLTFQNLAYSDHLDRASAAEAIHSGSTPDLVKPRL